MTGNISMDFSEGNKMNEFGTSFLNQLEKEAKIENDILDDSNVANML